MDFSDDKDIEIAMLRAEIDILKEVNKSLRKDLGYSRRVELALALGMSREVEDLPKWRKVWAN